MSETLLQVVFDRDALACTDTPLQFVAHEIGAIVERMPDELKLTVNTARRITVEITTDN